jgi:hypothetical protein
MKIFLDFSILGIWVLTIHEKLLDRILRAIFYNNDLQATIPISVLVINTIKKILCTRLFLAVPR